MTDSFDAFSEQLLETMGIRKDELAPSEYVSCSQYPPYKVYKYATPGDHIAAWSNSRGYWHHVIFFGEDIDDNDYVIDIMPNIGVSKRSFGDFLKGKDTIVIVHYEDAFDLDVSLKLAIHATTCYKIYNYATWKCDNFALLCRTGSYDMQTLNDDLECALKTNREEEEPEEEEKFGPIGFGGLRKYAPGAGGEAFMGFKDAFDAFSRKHTPAKSKKNRN